MKDDEFKHGLGDSVAVGDFFGTVIGCAAYLFRGDVYFVAFTNENGLPCEQWFEEYAITKVTKH